MATSSLSLLRGPALAQHMQQLSTKYGWSGIAISNSGGGNDSPTTDIRDVQDYADDVVPGSVTKRRGKGKPSSRRQSIHQSPARPITFPSPSPFAPLKFVARQQPPHGSSISNTLPQFLDLTLEEAFADVEEPAKSKCVEEQRPASVASAAAACADNDKSAGTENIDSPELVVLSRAPGRGRAPGRSAFIICDSSSPSSASSADEDEERGAITRGTGSSISSNTASRSKGASGGGLEHLLDKENVSANAKRSGAVGASRQQRPSAEVLLADSEDGEEEKEEEEEEGEEIEGSLSEESEYQEENEDWGSLFESPAALPAAAAQTTPHKPATAPSPSQSRRAYSTKASASTSTSTPRSTPASQKAPARAPRQSFSPSVATTPSRVATSSASARFRRDREAMTVTHFNAFNETAFLGKLPSPFPTLASGELQVKWNNRLLTTAGITKLRLTTTTTRFRRGSASGDSSRGNSPTLSPGAATQPKPKPVQVRTATIELSEKVVDNEERLKATLLHEMCHAAAWLLDHERKPPHGPAFWKYASIAQSALPGIAVSTCHSYAIHKPFKFRCTNTSCGQEYSRHSKSIDLDAKCCGVCKGKLSFVGTFNADGTPKKSRPITAFSLFVQENFASVKAAKSKHGSSGKKVKSHQDVMQELAAMYSAQKMRAAAAAQVPARAEEGGNGEDEDEDEALSLALGDLQLCVGVKE